MRLLLIFALLFASVSFGAPVNAHASGEHASHHSMAVGEHDQHQDEGKPQPLAHVCPGCALVGQAALATMTEQTPTLPPLLVEARSLSSFEARPIAPPPRRS